MQNESSDELAEAVARAVLAKFAELPKNGKPSPTEWTILAGLAASRPAGGGEEVAVVALATGSKCLGAGKLRPDGRALHDSHAEVLARRSLVHFLQTQLLLLSELGEAAAANDDCILQWAPEPRALSDAAGRLLSASDSARACAQVKSGVRFHLFVSQSPCGDASIFSRDTLLEASTATATATATSVDASRARPSGDETLPHAKRFKISTDDKRLVEISDVENRTGAKIVARESTGEAVASNPGYEGNRGERDGSKVQEEGMLRTKPGRGEATRSMSCSDKIARWNVLGLQGALLAPILGPVYLDSCVVSESTYNHEALARALGRRISHVSSALSGPYSLRLPRLLTCVASFPSSREEVEKRIISASLGGGGGSAGKASKGTGEAGGGGGRKGGGQRISCSPTGSSINWNAGRQVMWQTLSQALEGVTEMPGEAHSVNSESTIGNTGFRLGATQRTLATDASLSRLCKLSLFRRHLDVLSSCSRFIDAPSPEARAGSESRDTNDAHCADRQGKLRVGDETAHVPVAVQNSTSVLDGGQRPGQDGPAKDEVDGNLGGVLADGTAMDSEGSAGRAWPSIESKSDGALIRYVDAKRQDRSYGEARQALLMAFEKLGAWLVNDEALSHWTCKGRVALRSMP